MDLLAAVFNQRSLQQRKDYNAVRLYRFGMHFADLPLCTLYTLTVDINKLLVTSCSRISSCIFHVCLVHQLI